MTDDAGEVGSRRLACRRVLLGEGSGDERDAMLGDVHAPALVDVEETQTLRGLLRAGKIDLGTADLGRGTTASTWRSPKAGKRR